MQRAVPAYTSCPRLEDLRDRVDRLENFRVEDGRLRFDITRHPSVEGLATKGMPSPGYFLVRETYSFDPQSGSVDLCGEDYFDMVIESLAGLLDQDVFYTVDMLSDEIDSLQSESDARAWAENQADEMGPRVREGKHPPSQLGDELLSRWHAYLDGYIACWKKEFVRQAVVHWRSRDPE